MTRAWLCLVLVGCGSGGRGAPDAAARDAMQVPDAPCTTLFGRPGPTTGLGEATCRPTCGCGGEAWRAPEWSAERVAALRAARLVEAQAELPADPYEAPVPPARAAVCGVVWVDRARGTYRLETFASTSAAEAAGAVVTHADACGLCSSLHDLAVYASMPDLGEPVRACGLEARDLAENVACLEALGFSRPCAQIWAYNTRHTKARCLEICVAAFADPYNLPDGTLNPCLHCDERLSGPVFKAIAGRTRRNTGIPNAICRPCAEVIRLEHAYGR